MNYFFSVIIICKNEAHQIAAALQSVQALSNDIVVYDSGSTDGTQQIAGSFPVRLVTGTWEGYGKTRQKAAAIARHNWVFFVDADETVTPQLAAELQAWKPHSRYIAYQIKLQNFLGNRLQHWGAWRNDYRVRLFEKNMLQWNTDFVHEKLVAHAKISVKKLRFPLQHATAKNTAHYFQKMMRYALLTAAQYHTKGKKAGFVKCYVAPAFTFVKNYFFLLGFLDGKPGFAIAWITARYTRIKYARLRQLNKKAKL